MVGYLSYDFLQVIPYEKGEDLADKFNVKFIETSAKNDINIAKAFLLVAKEAKRAPETNKPKGSVTKLPTHDEPQNKAPAQHDKCCT